ncbi:uncharacterized protein LOC113108833 [Carassius auratus]|uniref:Uncharacterized protein LOC113108833 n=1 Tax=Carassius auratus TaxID=7957 RepID=A0A6P6Q2X4_CARAU|nr:uncharacterized protein LOC113108833 [Carassius auratus]
MFRMCVALLVFSSICTVVVGAPVIVTGFRGESFNIRCPYGSGYESHVKYLCKGECRDRQVIVRSGSPAEDERFSLRDDTTARVFTVTITDLRPADVGQYWCGVERSLLDDVYSEILLLVKHDNKTTEVSTISPFTVTSSYFSTTETKPQPSSITITDQHKSTDLASVAGGLGSVLLVLVLCSGTFLILKKRKRKSGTALFQQNVPHNTETDRMYEEIPNCDDITTASSSNQTPASHHITRPQVCTVYAKVTNQQPDSNPHHTHSTNQVTDTDYDYYANLTFPEPAIDRRTELIYTTATHPQNIKTKYSVIKHNRERKGKETILSERNRKTVTVLSQSLYSYLSKMSRMCVVLLVFSSICTVVVGAPDKVTGYRGERVNIRCSYESGYESNPKYLCKGECRDRQVIVKSGSPAKDPRFSLRDNTTARVFTVTITDLRPADAGQYWCGVERSFNTDVYSQILLLVKQGNETTVVSTISPSSAKPSYFSTTETKPQPSSISITDQHKSTEGDVLHTDDGSIIYISVGLVIVLVIFFLVLVLLCLKRSRKSPGLTQSGLSQQVSVVLLPLNENTAEDFNDHKYEEINKLQHKNKDITSVYITDKPEDPKIYTTADKPDVSTIYSTADKPDVSTIYTTADKPDVSTIYTTADKPDVSTIYTTADKPDVSTIYTTADKPEDPMIYSTADEPDDSMIYTTVD